MLWADWEAHYAWTGNDEVRHSRWWASRGSRKTLRGGFCRPGGHKTQARAATHLIRHLEVFGKRYWVSRERRAAMPKKMPNGPKEERLEGAS